MIWHTEQRHHEWSERLPLDVHRLVCVCCGVERPMLTDWLSYSHHCPLRVEVSCTPA